MSHDWSAVHARKLAAYTRLGVAVTFSETVPGSSYSESTETWSGSPATTSIAGYAVRGSGDPVLYEKLGLIESESPTLSFTPNTFGQVPSPGMTVTFGGVEYRARNVKPFAPAGVVVSARIVMVR